MNAKALTLLPELAVNLLLPYAVYQWTLPGWGEHGALLWSALPPTAWSAWELARHRRLDALSLMVLAGIALSLLAMLGDGDARWLLARESLASGAIGAVFLASLALRRPLVTHLALAGAARRSAQARAQMEQGLGHPAVARGMRLLTLWWGGGLVAECALRLWLAFHWPATRVLALAPWISYGVMGLLAAGTWLGRRRRRLRTHFAS